MKQNLDSEQALPHSDSNRIIDGHGTGYLAPSLEDLDSLIGKTTLLEPIEDENTKLGATADISTEMYFPAVGNQASQGSCTVWAMAYYAYGYLEAKDHSWDASSGNPDYLLSPAWIYNMVATENNEGSSFLDVAQALLDWGVPTLSAMPYDDTDVDSWGNEIAWRQAPYHRPLSYSSIYYSGVSTINTIISLLDGGTPVTFAIDADQFSNGLNEGTSDFILSSDEYIDGIDLDHAQCIVGYNDSITEGSDVGAFRVVNSWGDNWMDGGYYWLTYNAFDELAGDWWQVLMYITDRADYNPDLIATWEFSTAPTRMNDIVTLGVGPQTPTYTIRPLYDDDPNNVFPSFMALDISAFNSSYTTNNDVFFSLEIGSSTATGTISSFRVERYFEGVLQEISPESPGVPEITPCRVNTTFMKHDLRVVLEVPTSPIINNTYLINAKVINNGLYNETGIYVELLLDGEIVASTIIPKLLNGSSFILDYNWTPSSDNLFNFTAQAPPISGETYISNNYVTKLIQVWESFFYDDFESGLSKWDSFTGLWHLTNDSSAWSDPYHSPTHSMWFGDESIGTYNTEFFGAGELTSIPFNLTYKNTAFLEFYHWREAEGDLEYDVSKVYISTDGMIWDELYVNTLAYVPPWSKVSIDLSPFIGNSSIQIRFHFIIGDLLDNDYRGWLVDDVAVLGLTNHHDLSVSMEVPENPEIGNSYMINGTVTNIGASNEKNINFFLYLNGEVVNSTNNLSLNSGANFSLNYNWTPSKYAIFNFTAQAYPVLGESYISNNHIIKIIPVWLSIFYDDFESGLSNWDSITGLWHLTNDSSAWSDPYHSPTHSMWFGSESTGNYDTGNLEVGELTSIPFDLSRTNIAYLEFYHWREGEGSLDYDISSVGISTDGMIWDEIYVNTLSHVSPWEKISIDLSAFTGSPSVQIRFYFNTYDNTMNNYRGWLVDDVEVLGLIDPHALSVRMDIPKHPEVGNSYMINGTVTNIGTSNENNINFFLYLNGEVVNSTNNLSLNSGANFSLNYNWTPSKYAIFNFTVYTPPIAGETFISDNIISEIITVLPLINYTETITLYSWIDASGGTELNLGDDDHVTIDLPFIFPFYNQSFSKIYLSSNGYLSFTDEEPEIYDNTPFPSAEPRHAYMIAPFWDDLKPNSLSGGHVYVQDFGDHWVAEWLDIYRYGDILIGSFEVVLYDTGEIIFNYDYINYTAGVYTCGLNLGVDTDYYNSYIGLDNTTNNFSLLYRYELPNPPDDFTLSSDAGEPDLDGTFVLMWSESFRANNYSIYEYSSYITTINGSLSVLADEVTDLSLTLTDYIDGTYYFIIVAHNDYGDTLSNCIEITVEIPPPPSAFTLSSNAGDPDTDGNFDLQWTASSGALSYSLYHYSNYITEINSSLTILARDITDLNFAVTDYDNGVHYFIVVASNIGGETLSNCLKVTIQKSGALPGIPGYNMLFLTAILGAAISLILKKKLKTNLK